MSHGRLLFIGEGLRDIGSVPAGHKLPCDHEGDLPRMLRRLFKEFEAPERLGYEGITVRDVVSAIPRVGRGTRSSGKRKDLRDAVIEQLRHRNPSPLAIVAVIDARSDELGDLRKGAIEILRQGEEHRPDVPVVIGFAVQEIEIWMLADRDARIAAFGESVGSPGIGERLEEVGDPKSRWSERAGQSVRPEGRPVDLHTDMQRVAAWEAMDPKVVAKACPKGFEPLREDVRALTARVFGQG